VSALRRRLEVDIPDVGWLLVPLVVGLACTYVVVLALHLPALLAQLNTDGDVSTAWLLASVAGSRHTGSIVTSAQGGWVSLGFGVLTRGLALHRLLWALSPLLLSAIWLGSLGRTVARLADRRAGLLTVALVFCASPTMRTLLIAPWFHNTTLAGVVVCGAWLVRLQGEGRSPVVECGLAAVTGLLLGALIASDALLLIAGLIPFGLVVFALAIRTRDRAALPAAAVMVAAALIGDAVSDAIVRRLGLFTAPSPLHLSLTVIPQRTSWVLDSLLRLGGGLPVGPVSPVRAVIVAAAAVATISGVGILMRVSAHAVSAPGVGRDRARSAHVMFWSASATCSVVAYLLTVTTRTDRYLATVVLAVAATVPLLLDRRSVRIRVLAGACAFLAASTVALAAHDTTVTDRPGLGPAQASEITALVRDHRLGVGYAGYWEAAPLDWVSRLRLRIYPVTDILGRKLRPSWNGTAAAWYRPRRSPSFLLLEPGDVTLADRLPASLPRPSRIYHVGVATIAAYRFDIAGDFGR
jgi:hypothetical protein